MMSNVTGSAIQLKHGEPAHRDRSKLTNFIRNYTTGMDMQKIMRLIPQAFRKLV
jgi:hypothetical protein